MGLNLKKHVYMLDTLLRLGVITKAQRVMAIYTIFDVG